MIKTIDKESCRVIRTELEKVLPELGKHLAESVKQALAMTRANS